MKTKFETIETLKASDKKLLEVELILTPEELHTFADYCLTNDIKFNDWIRQLAYEALQKSQG